ncbi:MAG: hypothetical protein AB8H03_10290 [Saprospiraceae bacterium]
MKKLLLLVFTISIFTLSCNKNDSALASSNTETIPPIINSGSVEIRSDINPLDAVILNNGILEFTDMNHFYNSVSYLEEKIDEHEDLFVSTYPDFTDEELNDKEEEINFNPFQPAIDFETSKSFSSRRSYIESATLNWLNNEILDFNNDPDDWDNLDDIERSFFNLNGEVKIGNTVYNLNNFYDTNISSAAETCRGWWISWDEYSYDSNKKKMKIRVKFASNAFRMKLSTRVTSYKKGFLFWKRHRTKIYASVGGLVYPKSFCEGSNGNQVGKTRGPKKRKRLNCKKYDWFPPEVQQVKKGSISGYGWVGNSNNALSVPLTW